MPLSFLDHVNIRTARLDELSRFYNEVLGLELGERPPFGFPGAWLYCGERAAVHLVGVPEIDGVGEPRIEHFAFRAEDLDGFLARLARHGVAYETNLVPGRSLRQVHLRDPDGNHIEVAFPTEDAATP